MSQIPKAVNRKYMYSKNISSSGNQCVLHKTTDEASKTIFSEGLTPQMPKGFAE